MKELILWKEVDVKDELPEYKKCYAVTWGGDTNESLKFDTNSKLFLHANGSPVPHQPTHWLKRVAIPILSDQEIEELCQSKRKHHVYNDDKMFWADGYKAMQERLTHD